MQTIWKYKLAVGDNQIIEMPAGAQPIHVGMQAGDL